MATNLRPTTGHLDESVTPPNERDIKKLSTAAAVIRLRVKDGQWRNEVLEYLEEIVHEMRAAIADKEYYDANPED